MELKIFGGDAPLGPVALSLACVGLAAAFFLQVRFRSDHHHDDPPADKDHDDPNTTRRRGTTPKPIPSAPHPLPVLGHALAYRKDPASFLRSAQQAVGPVFRINLAGRRMIVVGSDRRAHHQVAHSAESVLSARQAVAEIGFEYTLGSRSVFRGTDFHKRCLKNDEMRSCWMNGGVMVARELATALEVELARNKKDAHPEKDGRVHIADLFDFFRRCFMRTTLNGMVGSCILESFEDNGNEFITLMMSFQDQIEDATAKGAVLPRFLAIPLVWQPVARARERLQAAMAERISKAAAVHNDPRAWGPWLRTFESSSQMELDEISELIVGLIFAAHKNPAIGSAQSLCYLLGEGSAEELQLARDEAKALLRLDTEKLTQQDVAPNPKTIPHCVLETARLCAHSIGSVRQATRSMVLETDDGSCYTVEQGETVCVSHLVQTTDPKYWGTDALEYRPKRFTEVVPPGNEARLFTTFSAGVHKCPGEKLALTMMETMLALVLERDPKMEGAMPPLSFERATLAQRAGPVAISIKSNNHGGGVGRIDDDIGVADFVS